MNTPLAGITVLDFGQIFQGPYATLLMAKAGANVIKIEPPHGEPGRRRAAPGKSATLPVASVTVAASDCEGSVTDVAITVTVKAAGSVAGAAYVVVPPPAVMGGMTVPQAGVHGTPL